MRRPLTLPAILAALTLAPAVHAQSGVATTRPARTQMAPPSDGGPTTAEVAAETTVDAQSVTGGGELFPEDSPQRILDVTNRVFPAVVRLDVAQEIYRDGKKSLQRGIGSGVIFDADGRILTNYHVAGRAQEIFVTLASKERVRGTLIGDDHWTDLAVVQLDMAELEEKGIDFAHADLAEDDDLVPGQDVIAIGTPFGLARTMSKGIVSNIERTFYPGEQNIDGYETGNFANWVQMDAPIAPGNSGGPLVDLNARVVGINTRGATGSDLNFAIPISTVRRVKDAILADAETRAGESASEDADAKETKGRVTRADLGLDLKPLQDLETFYNIDPNRGVLIDSVDRKGPAADAGLRVQDILLSIDGEPTNVRFPEELAAVRRKIADLEIGEAVEMTLLRGSEEMTVSATPTKLESAVGEERELEEWGLSVRDVTRPYANSQLLDDDKGVVVTTVRTGYPAQKAELSGGDVIRSVNGKPADDLAAFMNLYETAVEEKQKTVLLSVARRQGTRTVLLKVTY